MPRLERRGILDLSGHDRAKKPALAEPPATDQDLNPGDRVEGLGNFGKPTGEFGTEPGKQKRVEKLNIGDLDPMERERFSKQWESVQSRFVDSPRGAAAEADDLVSSLMKTRVSRIRFRSTGGRHFGRPSPSRGQLPVCARDCAAGWERRSKHGRSANGNDSLPLTM